MIRTTNAIQVPRVMDYQNIYNLANRNKTWRVPPGGPISEVKIAVQCKNYLDYLANLSFQHTMDLPRLSRQRLSRGHLNKLASNMKLWLIRFFGSLS
jgi:hypothetical protein